MKTAGVITFKIMPIPWLGNEYCWREEAQRRNAGCSELYIVHLLDTSAVIALQHNSGTTLVVPRVSALHYPPPPGPVPCKAWPLNTHKWKEMQRVPTGHRTQPIAVLIKRLWLCHASWWCLLFRTTEQPRGLKFPLVLSSRWWWRKMNVKTGESIWCLS